MKGHKRERTVRSLKTIWLAFTVILLILAGIIILVARSTISKTSIVATINNTPVTVGEYAQVLLRLRAETSAYFKENYGADDDPTFWTKSYGGEIPLEKIKSDALSAIARIKLQMLLAREKGLIQDISYERFLKDLVRENKRREEAKKNHQVIYGPDQYSEDVYFDILFSNVTGELKKKIAEENIFSAEELQKYYQDNIAVFKEQDSIITKRLSVHYIYDTESKQEAEKIINSMKASLDAGESFEAVSKQFSSEALIKIETGAQTFDSKSAKSDYLLSKELTEAARELDAGQVSRVIDFDGAFYLLQCVERTEGKTLPFEQVKAGIITKLSENEYEKIMDEMFRSVKVVIHDSVYNKIDERFVR